MTQAFNLSQFANSVNTSGQASLTTGVTGTLPVSNGGTGAATLTSNNVILGNGTSSVQFVAPGTSGNVLTSNGTTWSSSLPTGVPVGSIITFAGTSAPTGFLLCPTSLTNISRTTYSALFAVIGTTWGSGDGSTTFGLPWFTADWTTVQASANVGTTTTGSVISHTHTYNGGGSSKFSGNANIYGGYSGVGTTNATGGTDNLAAGARVLHCIKY